MDTQLVVLSLTGGLVIGAVFALAALRMLGRREGELHEQAVAAAVRAALGERGATAEVLERDRAQTVQAAVARAAEVADAKLDARLRQGTEKLDAGTKVFNKQAADINAELRRMQVMISELQERAAGQHGAVVKGLEQAARVTTELQQTAGGLREALASPKARGQWGERMAEDVLRAAGFRKGVNYHVQAGLETGGIPDFTFVLPRGMSLHMDVKFPIDNYLRYLEAIDVDESQAEKHRSQFRKDARTKVTELAGRGYAESADTVDYVLCFMPNESVYSFVHETDPDLLDLALANKVVLCGPSTLFAVLAVVRQAMDNFMVEKRGEEIMEVLSDFTVEWGKFSDHVDKLGRNLTTVQNTFDQLSTTRTNQMDRKLRRIEAIQSGSADAVLDLDDGGVAADPIEPDTDDQWPPLREVTSA